MFWLGSNYDMLPKKRRALIRKQKKNYEKNRSIVVTEFVKTCNELVIGSTAMQTFWTLSSITKKGSIVQKVCFWSKCGETFWSDFPNSSKNPTYIFNWMLWILKLPFKLEKSIISNWPPDIWYKIWIQTRYFFFSNYFLSNLIWKDLFVLVCFVLQDLMTYVGGINFNNSGMFLSTDKANCLRQSAKLGYVLQPNIHESGNYFWLKLI